MSLTLTDVMSPHPRTIDIDEPACVAARCMREIDAGSVIVVDHGRAAGIVTDRDLALRLVADELSPDTPVRQVATLDHLVTIPADVDLEQATRMMREEGVRRLVVTDGDTPIGIVALGDLAEQLDPGSVLGQISAQPSNN